MLLKIKRVNNNYFMKNKNTIKKIKSITSLIKFCTNLFKKKNIYYGHGSYNARTESIYLIKGILNKKNNLFKKTQKNNIINSGLIKKIIYLANLRIKKKIPIPYLTKKAFFCNKIFYINKNVIIPRSPISEIIKNKFKVLKLRKKPNKILDMCTGSGCIAICISYIFYKAKIDAVDISEKALEIAKKNIKLHKKQKNIKIIKSNLFENIKKKYDIIISNPPYVNKKDKKFLPKEYLHEPKIGLFCKNKGIFIIKNIINKSFKYLKKNGYLICEVGYQKKNIKNLFPNLNIKWIKLTTKGKGLLYIKKKN